MPLCQADWALLQMPHGGELADIPDLDGNGSLPSQAKQTELKGWDIDDHNRSLDTRGACHCLPGMWLGVGSLPPPNLSRRYQLPGSHPPTAP